MTTTTSTYASSNRRTFTTDAGRFMIERRNAGFADNDGRWIISQLPEYRWTFGGELRKCRHGAFLGSFDTEADAVAAAESAEQLPETNERAIMGRVSC